MALGLFVIACVAIFSFRDVNVIAFFFQYYFIKSHLNEMVLDVDKSGTCPGTLIFPYPKNGGPNQQWRFDSCTGVIRSKLDDQHCMDIECKLLHFIIL